jgi:hypothetical protein
MPSDALRRLPASDRETPPPPERIQELLFGAARLLRANTVQPLNHASADIIRTERHCDLDGRWRSRWARLLGVDPDAALLAVLIGASSDFLTPIGHHNNLLVMGPGGYRFTDYARIGAGLVVVVVIVGIAALVLSVRA